MLVSRMISCANLLPCSVEDFSLDCIRHAMAIISCIVATFQIAHFSRVYAAYGGVFVAMPPAVQPASSAPARNSRSRALLKIALRNTQQSDAIADLQLRAVGCTLRLGLLD